eukprot:gene49678-55604_t
MVGCWNERAYDAAYLSALRAALDARSLQRTKIIAPDGHYADALAKDMLRDGQLYDAVDAIGDHYPGMQTSEAMRQVAYKSSGGSLARQKLLFASEDYGALARLINQNYVRGAMSGTIAWNLVSSYYAPYRTAYYGPTD